MTVWWHLKCYYFHNRKCVFFKVAHRQEFPSPGSHRPVWPEPLNKLNGNIFIIRGLQKTPVWTWLKAWNKKILHLDQALLANQWKSTESKPGVVAKQKQKSYAWVPLQWRTTLQNASQSALFFPPTCLLLSSSTSHSVIIEENTSLSAKPRS